VRGFERFTGRFVTTDAVVGEAMRLVSRSPAGPGLLIDLLFSLQAAIHSGVTRTSRPVVEPVCLLGLVLRSGLSGVAVPFLEARNASFDVARSPVLLSA